MNVVVTGAGGFIGRHIVEAARRHPHVDRVIELRREGFTADLPGALETADAVFHLAGVNRVQDPAEFESGNRQLTITICRELKRLGRTPLLVLASSKQAALDNPYGRSKRAAEDTVEHWGRTSGATFAIFRIQNVFGKWCRPNYNSVVATFCHNIARDLPISISDPAHDLELVYIDDVVAAMLACLRSEHRPRGHERREIRPAYRITLGDVAERLRSFRASRTSLLLPPFDDELTRRLYATYASYLETTDLAYPLQQRSDDRGTLAEFLKSSSCGQLFVSRTKPGRTRGDHYHHSKAEKFLVLEGDAVVRLRRIDDHTIFEHHVSGSDLKVVDIPPGYTHAIQNIGTRELVTLFWASDIFTPQHPDTIALPVLATDVAGPELIHSAT